MGGYDRKEVHPMTKKDKATLVEGMKRICADLALLVTLFEDDAPPGRQDAPAEEEPASSAKAYT